MKKAIALFLISLAIFSSCKKESTPETTQGTPPAQARLIFVFKFDSGQVRLNNVGQPSTIPAGNAAQSPVFNGMAAHYIEMAQSDITPVGGGVKLYTTPTVTTAPVTVTSGTASSTFTTAIDFDQQPVKGQGQEFYSVPLSQVAPGTYKWLRISLAYQNYDIWYKYTYMGTPYYFKGTVSSFIGYQTHINSYQIKTQTITENANKLQGYWGFETSPTIGGVNTTTTSVGQAPQGGTTVVNPLFGTSDIPPGSCLVTGQFVGSSGSNQLLTITGNETQDIVIEVSLSTNKSFEWQENTGDTWYEPAAGDVVVDMGVRGMIPKIKP
jgi:hypothetical protein